MRMAGESRSDEELVRVDATFEAMRERVVVGDPHGMQREDRNLHRILLEASRNMRAARMVDELRDLVLSRGQTTGGRSRTLLANVDEHAPIIAAVRERSPGRAVEAMRSNLEASRDFLILQQAK